MLNTRSLIYDEATAKTAKQKIEENNCMRSQVVFFFIIIIISTTSSASLKKILANTRCIQRDASRGDGLSGDCAAAHTKSNSKKSHLLFASTTTTTTTKVWNFGLIACATRSHLKSLKIPTYSRQWCQWCWWIAIDFDAQKSELLDEWMNFCRLDTLLVSQIANLPQASA